MTHAKVAVRLTGLSLFGSLWTTQFVNEFSELNVFFETLTVFNLFLTV
jgi:hypothetical protein